MKTQLIICAIVSFSLSAFAAPQLACFDVAKNNRGFSTEEAIQLCHGAKSNWPVLCFDNSASRPLSVSERMTLCAGAQDANTLQCYDLSQNRGLTVTQILTLCAAR